MGMGPGLVITVRASRYEWAHRHAAPLIASVLTVVLGMDYVTLWPAVRSGRFGIFWAPSDLWGSYLGAVALVHGHLQSPFLGMVGSLLILAPAAAVGSAAHLEVGPNFAAFSAPTGWALMGPWMLGLSCSALFAFDAAARRLGIAKRRRIALGVVEAILLLNVTVGWGHPEDAVALALAVFAVLEVDSGRLVRGGWLLGAAVAVQPMAVLAVPALAVMTLDRDGRLAARDLLGRALGPYVVLLAPSLATHFTATLTWLVQQPNWPADNHATPFTSLAAHVAHSGGAVTAGPARAVGVLLGVGVAVCLARRADLERCLWAISAAFFWWAATDSVLDAYYTWPVLALGVVLAARWRWSAGAGAAALAVFATWFSDVRWHGAWTWWLVMVLLLAAMVGIGWYASNAEPREDPPSVTTSDSLSSGPGAATIPGVDTGPVRRHGRALVPPWTG
jgi:hypothetical protein